MVEYKKGMLVVAYPNLDMNSTELAFSYWLGPKIKTTEVNELESESSGKKKEEEIVIEWYDFEGETGEYAYLTLYYISMIMVICVYLLCIIGCIMVRTNIKSEF